ncbi:hypothetical protein BJ944DRAFT_156098 [Cunninghamella echinulata]|nr:hypothetical protein BJ944DRAFT_156098 [Cunninghamella echinulata]
MEHYVVIITGANSTFGIGWATALELAKKQPQAIYVTDIQDENLEMLVKKIQEEYKVKAFARKVDASSEDDVQKVVEEAVSTFGRLDVFFANAGAVIPGTLHNITRADFLKTMEINTWSVLAAIQHASLAMEKTSETKSSSGGSIIATASVAGVRSGAGPISYSASKAAVINIVQTSAWRLKGKNIRVNAICPGIIETNMTKLVMDKMEELSVNDEAKKSTTPLERYGTSSEIASTVAFLASPDASYINGQDIKIDGGLTSAYRYLPIFADC